MLTEDELTLRRRQAEGLLAFGRLRRTLDRRIEDALREQGLEGITSAQSQALMALFQSPKPLNARALAREMGVSEVTISRFIRALKKSGWVSRRRDPRDSRCWQLFPTPKARQAFPRFVTVFNTVIDKSFAGLPDDATTHFLDRVHQIGENLRD